MRLMIAGWQGQIAHAFVDVAPTRTDITALALGRPALDICEVRGIERALSENRPDVIINTAGYTAVDAAEDDPDRAFALNRDGARLLAEVAARRGVPVIHMSTVNIFDGTKTTPYLEVDPPAPTSVYGASKLEGERAVCAANPRHIILRTSWVFSPFGQNFVTTILKKARAGEPLRIVTDQYGSPTYAPDLGQAIFDVAARAHAAARTGDDAVWGTCNIANAEGPASWYELATEVCRAAGLSQAATRIAGISTADFPTRAHRPRNASLDTAHIESTLGIALRDWRMAVADCVNRLPPQ